MSDDRTSVDRKIRWFKDHPMWSVVILIGIILIAIGSISGAITNILDLGSRILKDADKTDRSSSQPLTTSSIHIVATHYPTGELYSVDPESGQLSLVSSRLGEPSAVAFRESGEIIVLDARHAELTGVDPQSGSHRHIAIIGGMEGFQGNLRPTAMVITSRDSAVVAVRDRLIRVNLDSGEETLVTQGGNLRRLSGVAVDIDGDFITTDLDNGVIEIDRESLSQTVLAHDGLVRYPRAPIVERSGDILVGTAGDPAAVLRIKRKAGEVTIVASGPFVTIAGLALAPNGSLFVADNGHGSPGDGFLARVDLSSGLVKKLVTSQTSQWKFLNGRGVAVSVIQN